MWMDTTILSRLLLKSHTGMFMKIGDHATGEGMSTS